MTTALAFSRFASRRAIAFTMATRPGAARCLSSQGSVAVEKLRDALEEYRVQKCYQEVS